MTHTKRMTVFAAAAVTCLACGAATTTEQDHETEPRENNDSPIAALDTCPTPIDSSLQAVDGASAGRATLYWNVETGDCALGLGREIPTGAEAILRFTREADEYMVLAVLPWLLRGSAPDAIEAERSVEVTAAREDDIVEVELVFDDDAVTVESVRVP